jgi:hypothetical protein
MRKPRIHVEDGLPRGAREAERRNVLGALAEARLHLLRLHNPIAIRDQEKIIKGYEARLCALNETEWLEI